VAGGAGPARERLRRDRAPPAGLQRRDASDRYPAALWITCYGAIGAIIGHEIGHGFDDQGPKYDGDGRLTDWWSATDRQAFETRTRSLIGEYNALAPKQTPDQHVNGALTIGENIGDLGGLGIAWKAYTAPSRSLAW